MTRDRRLLAAVGLLGITAAAALFQAGVIRAYLYAAVMGNWSGFPNPPARGPDAYCLDYCVADLPFTAGWIALGSFLVALVTVARAWWKPRA